MAKIYIHQTLVGTVFVTMSPDGNDFRQFDRLSVAELYCFVEYGCCEVCE
jgi:hypothetical protein